MPYSITDTGITLRYEEVVALRSYDISLVRGNRTFPRN